MNAKILKKPLHTIVLMEKLVIIHSKTQKFLHLVNRVAKQLVIIFHITVQKHALMDKMETYSKLI